MPGTSALVLRKGRENSKGGLLRRWWLSWDLRKGWVKLEGGYLGRISEVFVRGWIWRVREKEILKTTARFRVCPTGWTMVVSAEKRRLKMTRVWQRQCGKITNVLLHTLLLKYPRAKSQEGNWIWGSGFQRQSLGLKQQFTCRLGMEKFREKSKKC